MGREVAATPDTTKAMVFVTGIACLEVIRVIERFGNKVPLQGSAVATIYGECFIGTPAHCAMIDDNMLSSCTTKCIVAAVSIHHTATLVFIAHAETKVAYNDIIATECNGLVCYTYPVARRCLTGHGQIAFQYKFCFEVNSA